MSKSTVIIQINVNVEFKPAKIDDTYAVYEHWALFKNEAGEDEYKIMYAGFCKLQDLMFAPDARKNSAWRDHVLNNPNVIMKLKATYETLFEASNHRYKIWMENKPFCNERGRVPTGRTMIRCIETGEVFENSSKACEQYSIPPGNMSNHLNRKPGHKTLKGLTFERV